MKLSSRSSLIKIIGGTAVLIILLAVLLFNSLQNSSHEDYRNSNFIKFWIAGHMIMTGQNPYDPSQWYDEHINFGASQVPDRIFLYPLPQAYFLVPFALLPVAQSFIIWGVISQGILAAACFVLLNKYARREQNRLLLPLVIGLLFFGPIYLSLQIGSIGAIALAVLTLALFFIEEKKLFVAGLVLSLLILKPSQGLPILILLGFLFLINKNWNAVIGLISGGSILLISGLVYDLRWIPEFVNNSQTVSDRTLGLQSNIYSFAYLSCNQSIGCMAVVGSIGLFILLGFGCFYLWMHRQGLTTWESFNIIILIGFVSTIYLWSYDQLLFALPIIWIVIKLVEKTRSYLLSFLFLVGIDVWSFVALVIQAKTHKDLLSIITTLLIGGVSLWLLHTKREAPIDKPYSAA